MIEQLLQLTTPEEKQKLLEKNGYTVTSEPIKTAQGSPMMYYARDKDDNLVDYGFTVASLLVAKLKELLLS